MTTPDRYPHAFSRPALTDAPYRCEHCGLIDPDDGTESECPVPLRAEVERLAALLHTLDTAPRSPGPISIHALRSDVDDLRRELAQHKDATDPRKLWPPVETSPGYFYAYNYLGFSPAFIHPSGWSLNSPLPPYATIEQGPETGAEGIANLRVAAQRHGYTWRTP